MKNEQINVPIFKKSDFSHFHCLLWMMMYLFHRFFTALRHCSILTFCSRAHRGALILPCGETLGRPSQSVPRTAGTGNKSAGELGCIPCCQAFLHSRERQAAR